MRVVTTPESTTCQRQHVFFVVVAFNDDNGLYILCRTNVSSSLDGGANGTPLPLLPLKIKCVLYIILNKKPKKNNVSLRPNTTCQPHCDENYCSRWAPPSACKNHGYLKPWPTIEGSLGSFISRCCTASPLRMQSPHALYS